MLKRESQENNIFNQRHEFPTLINSTASNYNFLSSIVIFNALPPTFTPRISLSLISKETKISEGFFMKYPCYFLSVLI